MPGPISEDLRRRVVEAYDAGEGSVATLADLYRVGVNSVQRWLATWRATGAVAPKPHAGGRAYAIDGDTAQALRTLVAADADATLDELIARLAATTGVRVGLATMSTTLARLGLPRKKSRRTRASSTGPTSSSRARRSRPRTSRRSTRAT